MCIFGFFSREFHSLEINYDFVFGYNMNIYLDQNAIKNIQFIAQAHTIQLYMLIERIACLLADFSSSRINVNVNLYFLNACLHDYSRRLLDEVKQHHLHQCRRLDVDTIHNVLVTACPHDHSHKTNKTYTKIQRKAHGSA